jgi:hypothetical protein
VSPTFNTSPPSSVPGARMRLIEQPIDSTTFSTSRISGLRESAPGRAMTATFLKATIVSSMNAESGQSSASGTSMISQPASHSTRTYCSHCRTARSTSTGTRSMWVTIPSARRELGRLTSAFIVTMPARL